MFCVSRSECHDQLWLLLSTAPDFPSYLRLQVRRGGLEELAGLNKLKPRTVEIKPHEREYRGCEP